MLNKRQKTSLTKFCWSVAKITLAVVVFANIFKSDIPMIRTYVLCAIATVFALIGFYLNKRWTD